MKFQHRLKTVRKGVAVFVIALISFSFFDFYGLLSPSVLNGLFMAQFGPSLVKAVYTGGAALIAVFALFLVTLLFGRIYCSFLCPLGIFKDIFIRFSKQKKTGSSKPHNVIRYTLLACVALPFIFGNLLPWNLLDPFSIYGRMAAGLLNPLVSGINNLFVRLLEGFDQYWLMPRDVSFIPIAMLCVAFVYLFVIVFLAVTRGRFYCNTICPVGALLGLLAKYSLYRVAIDPETCVSCRKCERSCKSGCIDSGQYHVDMSRCVSCFNCLSLCPENSLKLTNKRNLSSVDNGVDEHKRTLMVLIVCFLAFPRRALASMVKPLVYVKNKIPVIRSHPVTPPGSLSMEHFTRLCISCHVCVSHCPGHVIQPHINTYGKRGLFMPGMDNARGFCNFNCTTCGEVCPTGAIRPLTLSEKQQVQIGVVRFIRENCIVITQKTECGACSEHCPTKAVSMVVEGGLRVPKVNPDICVGCGACEYACPSLPHKSIYVEGNPVHKRAEKPVSKKEETMKSSDDFPF